MPAAERPILVRLLRRRPWRQRQVCKYREGQILLESRVALVTGACGGIGREIAAVFAREGARVAGLDLDPAAGDALVAALEQGGARDPLFVQADVRVPADIERAVGQVVAEAGRVDVLVTCAGVREIADAYSLPSEEWDDVVAINLSGVFHCCREAARRMRVTGGGSIVNVSSVAGLIGIANRPAYSATKHGVVGLTKSLACDFAPDAIRVNAICPGVVRTPLTERYFADDSFERGLAAVVPLARVGTPSDVANAALYLASDLAAYVTGVALPVDGGWVAEKSFVSGRQAGSPFLAG